MKFSSDVDIDFASRDDAIKLLNVIPASIVKDGKLTRHNTGVYPTDIPVDPFTSLASLDYEAAESRGYVKLDLLNVHVYKQVKNEQHLVKLMREPDWTKLYDPAICAQLIHLGNHYDTLLKMPEPVDSVARLMMFLAIIRPAKRHLIGKTWKEVSQTIWDKVEGEYAFKQSHSCAYAHLVIVHMNLLEEQRSISN